MTLLLSATQIILIKRIIQYLHFKEPFVQQFFVCVGMLNESFLLMVLSIIMQQLLATIRKWFGQLHTKLDVV